MMHTKQEWVKGFPLKAQRFDMTYDFANGSFGIEYAYVGTMNTREGLSMKARISALRPMGKSILS